eukprot:TRINITY_DN10805_c0_g1_i4.p1 TRINITY_DN10805_c0_g1~~TRINITY_DN10805_c0_g1_i4.p1  ORF type:complete len:220 (+),score=-2.03 TRINITY_DN10805_c0_g1_i4:642-1301(+)
MIKCLIITKLNEQENKMNHQRDIVQSLDYRHFFLCNTIEKVIFERERMKEKSKALLIYAWMVLICEVTLSVFFIWLLTQNGDWLCELITLILPNLGYAIGVYYLIKGLRHQSESLLSCSLSILVISYIICVTPFTIAIGWALLDRGRRTFYDEIILKVGIPVIIYSTLNTCIFVKSAYEFRTQFSKITILSVMTCAQCLFGIALLSCKRKESLINFWQQ